MSQEINSFEVLLFYGLLFSGDQFNRWWHLALTESVGVVYAKMELLSPTDSALNGCAHRISSCIVRLCAFRLCNDRLVRCSPHQINRCYWVLTPFCVHRLIRCCCLASIELVSTKYTHVFVCFASGSLSCASACLIMWFLRLVTLCCYVILGGIGKFSSDKFCGP